MERTTLAPHTPMVEFGKVVQHENAVKHIGIFFVVEVQMKPRDFQKHWTLPKSVLRNTIWMHY